MEVAEFSLDHAIVKLGATLYKQISGIPMGDPLSPGMTIGTCCWMENKWMQEVQDKDKQTFRAKRYMDDILIWYIRSAGEQEIDIIERLQASECYWPPLELEDAGKDTFLETRFMIKDNNLRTWLKNDNEMENKIWRYQDFRSYGKYLQKKAIIQTALRKVHHMASDNGMLMKSALDKLREFANVGYPAGVRRYVCVGLGYETGNDTWFIVSKMQKYISDDEHLHY